MEGSAAKPKSISGRPIPKGSRGVWPHAESTGLFAAEFNGFTNSGSPTAEYGLWTIRKDQLKKS